LKIFNDSDDVIVVPHNHPSSSDDIEKLRMKSKLKDMSKIEIYSARQIYETLVLKNCTNICKPDKKNFYKNVYNIRKSENLKSKNGDLIPLSLQYTYKKEKFIQYISDKDEIIIFSTKKI
jgi:hypothetical protein